MSIPPAQAGARNALAAGAHPGCFVCASSNLRGLHLSFEADRGGGVSARFGCEPCYEGYSGFIHGGVIAALLDGAMAHCLFARGVEAVTARLQIEYKKPLRAGVPAMVRAKVSYDSPPLYRVEGVVVQEGGVRASAEGTFLRADEFASP